MAKPPAKPGDEQDLSTFLFGDLVGELGPDPAPAALDPNLGAKVIEEDIPLDDLDPREEDIVLLYEDDDEVAPALLEHTDHKKGPSDADLDDIVDAIEDMLG